VAVGPDAQIFENRQRRQYAAHFRHEMAKPAAQSGCTRKDLFGLRKDVVARRWSLTSRCAFTVLYAPGRLRTAALADCLHDGMLPAALKEDTMAEAKLAPNLPDWMVEHANRYRASGGADGHQYKITIPVHGDLTVPALLLTTTGRKSGEKFIFPLFYGTEGNSYFVVASKGGAPEHPGWYRNILANPEVEVQVGTKTVKARARTTSGEERERLWVKALKFWPPYADYKLKTEREIPVVVLDPIH
jgi:deazaflavin-dependent oxidoreductase (nitroreductase family)